LKIDRTKGVPFLIAKFAKSAIEGKSKISGISWGKSIKVVKVLIIINVTNAIEIKIIKYKLTNKENAEKKMR